MPRPHPVLGNAPRGAGSPWLTGEDAEPVEEPPALEAQRIELEST
jgi:hypothetical protein